MGKVLEKFDWGNIQKRTKKGCMPFYHSVRNSILEVVSTRRNRTIGEKETCRATTKGQEKKGEFEGKVYKKQKTFQPYTHLS
jgi:hypothetical protein